MTKTRWLVALAVLCVVVAAAAVAYAAGKAKPAVPVQEVVRAQKFELVDEKGKVRAELSIHPDGLGPILVMYDQAGDIRADLSVVNDGPARLVFHEKGGKRQAWLEDSGLTLLEGLDVRAALSATKDPGPARALYDQAGKQRAALELRDNSPMLRMFDQAKQCRVVLAAEMPATGPGLAFADRAGGLRANLGLSADGCPLLILYDERSKMRAGLNVFETGPSLMLYDRAEKERAGLGAISLPDTRTGTTQQRSESSLVLSDIEGKVMWQAP
jgi:hypothetical protein